MRDTNAGREVFVSTPCGSTSQVNDDPVQLTAMLME